jgi:hypothetical protein
MLLPGNAATANNTYLDFLHIQVSLISTMGTSYSGAAAGAS